LLPCIFQNAKRKAAELEDFGPADDAGDAEASGSKRQRAAADVASKFAELIGTFSPETPDEKRVESLRDLRRSLAHEIAEAGIAPALMEVE
jgi:hypothetical protein